MEPVLAGGGKGKGVARPCVGAIFLTVMLELLRTWEAWRLVPLGILVRVNIDAIVRDRIASQEVCFGHSETFRPRQHTSAPRSSVLLDAKKMQDWN
jgi:hypothetical protein